ncbi:unnamed protein product [Mycena citricolor]|uniref:GDP-fucose protein O-fucosyltransferase 2 n=1 Tax=Mycena citricolor TaxID=2018698 RepID=A0AAD2HBF2_9AGAR|nr:unnamed protein product [Mycena citricolor]
MPLVPTPSLARWVHPKFLLCALLLGYGGYNVGFLSRESVDTSALVSILQGATRGDPLRAPVVGPRPPLLHRPNAVTTVQAAHATVTTVVTEYIAVPPREPESPRVLKGLPTDAFRDNLQPGTQYITSWPGSGWTNDVMLVINLIYLALLTERVPIVPFFVPLHVSQNNFERGQTLDFGEVFDIPRLSKAIRKPVLEWWEVKNRSTETVDTLGCWNLWQAVSSKHDTPHWTHTPVRLNIDVSYTQAPSWIQLYEDDSNHMKFSSLSALSFPQKRSESLLAPAPAPRTGAVLPPDQQVLCYDNLYWANDHEQHELEKSDYSPAWRFVGHHLHWSNKLQDIGDMYIREALGVPATDPIPPYIAVHARHGDFVERCDIQTADECFTPLPALARRVEEVQSELLRTHGLAVSLVVMTSDEKDPDWWNEVSGYGWKRLDHSETAERYGFWYPILIDAVVQSGSTGFVGTDQSTVSFLAGRRVKGWRNGVTRFAKWGSPQADDH